MGNQTELGKWIGSTKQQVYLWLRLQQGSEEVAMAILVLAPVLKVFKEWVELVVRVALQVPVDADVPPVANLAEQAVCQTHRLSRRGSRHSVLPQKPAAHC